MFLDDAGTQTSSLTGNEGIPRSLKTSDDRFGSFRSTWNNAYFPSWPRLFFSLTYQVGYNIPPIPHFEIMTNPDGVLQKTPLLKVSFWGESNADFAIYLLLFAY